MFTPYELMFTAREHVFTPCELMFIACEHKSCELPFQSITEDIDCC